MASVRSGGVLLASLGLLIVMAAFFAAPGMGKESAAIHITSADWQVQEAPGFRELPSAVQSEALPASWQTVGLPLAPPIALLHQAGGSASSGPTRITWLRLSTRGLPGTSAPLALYGARIKTDGTVAVYANGRLVHRAQAEGPLWNSTRTPLWIALGTAPAAEPLNEILLRLEHTGGAQVSVSSLWLGPATALEGRYRMRQWLQQDLPAMLSTAFMAVGVFSLFVWFRRSHETGYLLFFNLATTSWRSGPAGTLFTLWLPLKREGRAARA